MSVLLSVLLEKTFQIYGIFLFHDRMFCHTRSRENMARPVNLHGRPLDRCTIVGSVPQRNARIMNPKNPDLDLI